MVEELCRFVLEDEKLTLAVKKIRGRLSRVVKSELRSRNAAGDVGKESYTRDEGQRANLESVFHANMKRAQEAVRCLEEFSKLIRPRFGKAYKNIRFKLYELEKQIAPRVLKAVKLDFDLYVVIDTSPSSFKTMRKAAAKGVKIIQLRDKTVGRRQFLRSARKIARITRRAGMTFILNDHWGLVNRVGADGVHLGQDDFKKVGLRKLRKELGEEAIIGISASNLKEVMSAERMGADYVGVGPIFSTPIKPELKPLGIKLLAKIVKRVRIPVVAIGGIDRTNVDKVRRAGCRRVAVIRAAHELIGNRPSVIIG